MMTREDVLRELELLPVWQLRAPLATAADLSSKVSQQVGDVRFEAKHVEVTEKSQPLIASEARYFALVSDDQNWAFVLPQALTSAANALFNNILLALQINKTHTQTVSNLTSVKVIVAFGELVAQQLLGSTDSIEQLRGKPQMLFTASLIVTYHPNDLLQDLALKAKMWDDLCTAKLLVASKN
ncbi:MAG: hypothetical protein H7Z20_06460 [Bdellovibrio sp.]|nr:hypothetical protein [Methylotenera sp.]